MDIQRSGYSGGLIRGKVHVNEVDRGFVSGDVLHGEEIGWIDVVVVVEARADLRKVKEAKERVEGVNRDEGKTEGGRMLVEAK
ncbi:hypothetical protein HO173_002614 [Letharia columbiana]|uniref:Uncharacterized protein n=1 Tax=Letharia columbiana TaxID=112416 RepID=A0A8H6L8E2_9LECA|nr:uncharacterized protein HO173_002614 [Letharia columbiana]KAF6239352.1 hypothetical protein HO173_002614 [Letharia columbiana]